MVLDVEEAGVDGCLSELGSEGLAVIEVAGVERCKINNWNLLWSAVARWDIQDISEHWSIGSTKLELSSGRLGFGHLECVLNVHLMKFKWDKKEQRVLEKEIVIQTELA